MVLKRLSETSLQRGAEARCFVDPRNRRLKVIDRACEFPLASANRAVGAGEQKVGGVRSTSMGAFLNTWTKLPRTGFPEVITSKSSPIRLFGFAGCGVRIQYFCVAGTGACVRVRTAACVSVGAGL